MDPCSPNLTASCQRVCTRFESCCAGDDLSDLGQFVFALLAEESIGGACLHRLGLTMDVLAGGSLGAAAAKSASYFLAHDFSTDQFDDRSALQLKQQAIGPNWYSILRDRAAVIAKRCQDGPSVSSEHLVIAMTAVDGFVKQVLQQHGIQQADVVEFFGRNEPPVESLNVDLTLSLDEEPDDVQNHSRVTKPMMLADDESVFDWNHTAVNADVATKLPDDSSYNQKIHALLDANLNRAREGLRVLEDCARFVLCCVSTTERLKNVRHRLVEAEVRLRKNHPLIQRRNVEADAGTGITTANEQRRSSLQDIITANCRRMQEAIRSLEEFGKLIDGQFSESCKQLRYQTYQAEQMLESRFTLSDSNPAKAASAANFSSTERSRQHRQQLLNDSRLYVLITEQFCSQPWKQTAEAVLVAGADILQLREKQLATPELRRRAIWLQDLCLEHDSLFFINDDATLAKDIGADGLHVGQTDLPVDDARQILHPDQLIGLSTHDLNQLQSADQLNVDYVGVGPMFSTNTKSFDEYSGPAFAAEASEHTTLPWFAIGGIEESNLSQLIDVGVRRIAVCGTVLSAPSPSHAAAQLKQSLLKASTQN